MSHWSKRPLGEPDSELDGLSPEARATVLNYRAWAALEGENAWPARPLIKLLLSDAEIRREVRDLIASAIIGDVEHRPRLEFVGNVGFKSQPGLEAQRREWLDLADDFESSGLTEREYLESDDTPIHRDSRKLLQEAKAFKRSFDEWRASDPAQLRGWRERTPSDRDWEWVQRARFCEFVVEEGLMTKDSLRDYLRGG